ncbi:hypothetical protein [Spirillospora sp. NPDC029432]|uniref:HAAS signaling domain-containing protein n=1 Tax=Spirillospora sp. NPDC029432 TaxID=3154599 RepID=UPI0034530F4E
MTSTDHLITEYLDRLEAAARTLPAERRADLLAEIREHIAVAVAEQAGDSEAGVRNVLDRLGDPAAIVREAAADAPADLPAPRRGAFGITGAALALAAAAAGILLPVIGSLIAAALIWVLTRWPVHHKLLVAAAWPIGLGMGAWHAGPGASESTMCSPDGTCTTDGLPIEAQMGLGLALMLAAVLATALVARHDRRAA